MQTNIAEMCTRGDEEYVLKERAQDCTWHVFGQAGYLYGHLEVSLWQEGKITVYCFILLPIHNGTSNIFMPFFVQLFES